VVLFVDVIPDERTLSYGVFDILVERNLTPLVPLSTSETVS
jgi:hypothetical protein